jgi:hypothetical protein
MVVRFGEVTHDEPGGGERLMHRLPAFARLAEETTSMSLSCPRDVSTRVNSGT